MIYAFIILYLVLERTLSIIFYSIYNYILLSNRKCAIEKTQSEIPIKQQQQSIDTSYDTINKRNDT